MIDQFWDARTARILFTVLLFALVLGFLHGARGTLTLFLFSVLFAYFVEPLVCRLDKPLHGRIKAISTVYAVLSLLLIAVGFLAGPRIASQGRSLSTTLPAMLDKMDSGQIVSDVGREHGWSFKTQQQTERWVRSHRMEILAYEKQMGSSMAEPAKRAWWLFLIPILSLLFLRDGRSIAAGTVHIGRTRSERSTLREITKDVNIMLGSYIRAQMILSALTMVAYTVALSLMRVPYALFLGPLAGLFEFVPVVGPAVAAASVLAIAFITGYSHIVWLVVFLGVWRLVQDYVSAPRIMGESLEIPPLAQIFAVLAGGEIGGVVGALVSVPIVALLRILWKRISDHTEDNPEELNRPMAEPATEESLSLQT